MCDFKEYNVSSLSKTWIFDLDGTLLKHNGYKIDGIDSWLPGAREFLEEIPEGDMIIFLTSRTEEYRKITVDFLKNNKVRYNDIIFNAPYGERILVNDKKASGLRTAIAVNTSRDVFMEQKFIIDENL